jgi:hypothetical protein
LCGNGEERRFPGKGTIKVLAAVSVLAVLTLGFPYSCWLGIIHGSINVTESGAALSG